ncbi:MAG TPA: mannose-1-phosphate guanylyltransferase [Thermomicrobiales bacterium]|nr:mannose-1-phosphate guanylyltransferase [Thermomicrobiales bacterium]
MPPSITPHRNGRGSGSRSRPNFWAVIPAGGSGTRLWPLSRAARPKFLLPLLGERSLLQQTFERLQRVTIPERMLVVCGPAHAAAIARQLPELPSANIIVEPSPNGTGPALALATALIDQMDPGAIMGSFAADHDIGDAAAFERAVKTAIRAARGDVLVTIGLTPTRPDTGYGYIERTDEVVVQHEGQTAYRAARFIEKPDLERATEFVASGRFLWNAGMFVWRVQALKRELRRQQAQIHEGVWEVADAWESREQEHTTARIWSQLPAITIDHGIMEHAQRVAVVPAEMGWSDVGDWNGLGELIERDALGNSVRGDLLRIDTTNSVIWSETGRMVAMVGLDNIIVVDTEDALLVVDRAKSQEVKKVVEQLRASAHNELS